MLLARSDMARAFLPASVSVGDSCALALATDGGIPEERSTEGTLLSAAASSAPAFLPGEFCVTSPALTSAALACAGFFTWCELVLVNLLSAIGAAGAPAGAAAASSVPATACDEPAK